jgi:hypothetical protein
MAPTDNQPNEMNAFKCGQMVGLCIRMAVYFYKDVPAQMERDGFNKFTPEQNHKLENMIGWELLSPHASELAGRPITGKVELWKFYRQRILNFVTHLTRINVNLAFFILHRPVKEIFQFLSGLPKGFKAFLDFDGEFAKKGKRTEIFLLLLMFWPEIEEMRKSKPANTRQSLLDWLEKQEERQLVTDPKIYFAICDDIDLDMTTPGHPSKPVEI